KSSSPGSRSSDASSRPESPMGASPHSWMRRSRLMPCWHSLMVSKLPTPLEPSAQTSNASRRYCSRPPASSWAPRERRPTALQAPDPEPYAHTYHLKHRLIDPREEHRTWGSIGGGVVEDGVADWCGRV